MPTSDTAAFSLRPFDPDADFPRLVALLNATSLTPTTEEAERAEYARGEGAPRLVLVAEAGGEMAGFGISEPLRGPLGSDKAFRIWAGVFPAARRRGAGSTLFDRLAAFAMDQAAAELWANVRDDDGESRAFLERRGFSLAHHTFRSSLDLTAFDDDRWAGAIAKAEASGIRFTNFTAFGDSPETRRRLYSMSNASMEGEPAVGTSHWTFERFEQEIFGSPWFLPDGQVIALDGDEWVGMASVGLFPGADEAFHPFTGVRPEYRGRGIATALKVESIRLARRLGVSRIRTNNDSRNAPMLAINRKLGYQPQPGVWRMKRAKGDGATPQGSGEASL